MIKDICHSIFKYKKVGLNMKERKIYVCDFCNTPYNEKSKAEKCESKHKKFKEILYVIYKP